MSQNNKDPKTRSFWARQTDLGLNLVAKFITFPIETLKLVQQSKLVLSGGSSGLSGLQILENRVSTNGFFSLWSAFSYATLKVLLTDNLVSLISPTVRRLIAISFGKSYIATIIPGIVPNIISQCLTHPLDTLWTVSAVLAPASMSALLSSLSSRSTLQGASLTTRTFPILSALYAGLPITLLGSLCYRFTYFTLYDASKPMLVPVKDEKQRRLVAFCHGLGVAMAAAAVTYPLDTIRRVQAVVSMQGQETSILDAIRVIWNTSGITGFFAGENVNAIRTLASALLLLGLDRLVK